MTYTREGGGAVGARVPRAEARRLAAGRGRYTDDIALPRMAHVAFLRSPFGHARIGAIDTAEAAASPGVLRVVTGADLVAICRPMVTRIATAPEHLSPPQPPLAVEEAAWQGEPVAAVVARSRAEAEDALGLIEVDFEELPAVASLDAALAPDAPPAHSALATNLALDRTLGEDSVVARIEAAERVVEHRFVFGRQTAVSLEPRTIIADFDPAADRLTVHQSHQVPHQQQDVYARLLDVPEHRVRVICPDVGGAFGLKLHAFPDELAVCAIAKLMGRPVKFVSDRLESFLADAHSREFEVAARLGVDAGGGLAGFDADVRLGAGPYSIHPRGSIGDGFLAAMPIGAPYRGAALRARVRAAYQNKSPTGSYRGVGQPIACAVTEQMMDLAAHAAGEDPVAFRRRLLHAPEDCPLTTPGGVRIETLSIDRCLDALTEAMDYDGLRAEQARLRAAGRWRGIGVAAFVEQTAVGAGLYGPAGIRISAQDGATVKMEPSGVLRVEVGCTEQGQGTMTGISQIVADAFGTAVDAVEMTSGDSAGPYGGGTWASRGLSIGGEAAHRAAIELRARVLTIAGALLQADPASLSLHDGAIVDAKGEARMSLAEVGEAAYFRQDLLPPDLDPELAVTRHFVPRASPYFTANGAVGAHLELDAETGMIDLLGVWAVEDCGRVVNPLLVDEQIRGGIVQGIGAALYEHCVYDEDGQLQNGTMADYLVPMSAEMPDIVVGHVETPQPGTALGAKGAGEAGVIGGLGAMWCAVNDALRPLGARVSEQPFTPRVVLRALGRI